MTDYENKEMTGAEPTAPEAPQPVPQLTVDPEPAVPEMPEVSIPEPVADPFQSPAPPVAPTPEVEQPQQPVQPQYTAPVYGQPQQQYTPPQYGAPQPQYNQVPPQQPYAGVPYQQPQQQKPLYNVPPAGYQQKSRLAAGLLAIMLGCFGIHNYYLGYNTRATIQLVVSLATCGVGAVAMAIWGFVEGVLILGGSTPARNYDANGVILKD